MRILVSNDDGIHSPGLAVLARVARRFGEVRVVAPVDEQSSASHAITSARPLSSRRTPWFAEAEAYRVNGTPADCVALGLQQWDDVDLVLSGINRGVNLGNAIWHSGTVAAAKQASLQGVRAIAFSTPTTHDEPDYAALEPHVERVLRLLGRNAFRDGLPEGCRLVNVNLPPQPRGMAWARQAVHGYANTIVPDEDPRGRQIFWFTAIPIEHTEPGTDLWAFGRGFITLTPLTMELTDGAALDRAREALPLDDPATAPPVAGEVREHEQDA